VLVTNAPDESSVQLAARVGSLASLCEVISTTALSTSIYEVVLSGNAAALAGTAGNDVMIRLADDQGRFVRRRYSVRSLDEANQTFTLWITVDHEGPGSKWVKGVAPGDAVDVIGPRGKIPLDALADWHLFVGDASGLAAFYRMAETIEVPGRAIFIVEIDARDDALSAPFDEGLGVTGIFVDREHRSYSDPEGLLRGLAAFELPPDLGHAYLFGEFHVMRILQSALFDRGLRPEQVSHKAFWRSGLSNAEHGEPDKSDV
jgi:NADPH-dependent ferric siderophore reductase